MNFNSICEYEYSSRYSSFPRIYESLNIVNLVEPRDTLKCINLSSGTEEWSFKEGKNILELGEFCNNFYFSIFHGRRKERELCRVTAKGDSLLTAPSFRPVYFDDSKISDGDLNIYDADSLEKVETFSYLLDELKNNDYVTDLFPNVTELYPNLLNVLKTMYIVEITSSDVSIIVAIEREEHLKIKYIVKGLDSNFNFKNYLVLKEYNEAKFFNVFDIHSGEKLGEIEFSSNVKEIENKIFYSENGSNKIKVWSLAEGLNELGLEEYGEDVIYFFTETQIIAASANPHKNFHLYIYEYDGALKHHESFGEKGIELYSATSSYLALYKSNTIKIYSISE